MHNDLPGRVQCGAADPSVVASLQLVATLRHLAV